MEFLVALISMLLKGSYDPKDTSEHGNDEAYPFRDMREESKDD